MEPVNKIIILAEMTEKQMVLEKVVIKQTNCVLLPPYRAVRTWCRKWRSFGALWMMLRGSAETQRRNGLSCAVKTLRWRREL